MLNIKAYHDQVVETRVSDNDMLIGTNPRGWQIVRFGDVVDFHKGITYTSEDYCEKGKGVIFFNLRCVSKNGGFNSNGIKYYSGFVQNEDFIVPGDIVIANTDLTRDGDIIGCPVEIPEYYKDKAVCISMDLTKLISHKNLINKFCYYFLQLPHCRKFMKSHSSGSTVLHLNLNSVKKLLLYLPPLPVQHKIAAILSSVDAAIEQTDAIIVQMERMKKCLMQELFTKNIGNTEFKELSALARMFSGGTPLKSNHDYFNGTIPWVKSGELNNGVITSTNEFISEEGLENSSAKWVSENSILIAMYGATAGTVALLKIRATINQAILAVVPNDQMHYLYLYYYLHNTVKKMVGTLTQGSGQPNLNAGIIKKILVPCPSLSEQHRISAIISVIDQNLVAERKYLEQLKTLKLGLMQDLLSGRVPVKVDGHA